MTEQTKKILLIVIFIISVFAIGTILYFLFLAPTAPAGVQTGPSANTAGSLPTSNAGQPSATPTTPGEKATGQLPEADEIAKGGLTQTTVLTPSPIFDTKISSNGKNINYYDKSDDRFYAISSNGTVERLSNKQFPEAQNVSWNNKSTKAVIEFPDGSNVVYDFESEIQVTLPKHWEEFKFSPTSDEIIAKSIGLDSSNRAIVISNADGSQVRAVQALGENADKVDINPAPNDQIIAFSKTGDSQANLTTQMIIPIGKNQENFQGITVDGFGFEALWSPNGDRILYSAFGPVSDYKPLLWTIDGSAKSIGAARKALGIYTWVNKCVFADNDNVYCAVPQQLDTNAGFQSALGTTTPDDLYKINLKTGRVTLLARPAKDLSMNNLQISNDETILYYTNSFSGRLEFIKLK